MPPDLKSEAARNTDICVKWGKKTGGACDVSSMKTYVQNPKARNAIKFQQKINETPLNKFTRMQILSCIIQLEEKNFIECPNKGCRCICASAPDIADHAESCEGSKGNSKLKMCKYCPHGTLSTKTLLNHIVVSHPYASDTQNKNCFTYDNSVNDAIKTEFLSSENFQQTIKNHWRIYLESKGFIMCLIPLCHYVTGLISEMAAHFPACGPDVWDKLTYSCTKCLGRTFSKVELVDHMEKCHTSEITFNTCDEKVKEFWELTLQEYQVSKCVSKNCKFVAHNITLLEKHYRYCRNPNEENFEVCTICGGWLENTYDLWRHETHFHVIGKTYKTKRLMSLNVQNFHESLRSKKLSSRTTPPSNNNPQRTSEEPTERYMKEVVLKKTTFLGELAKTIESESNNSAFINGHSSTVNNAFRVTVENQFSWAVKAPDLTIATEVVNRRLPSYSVKTIMAESIEDGARLLKLTESVASITCNSSKKYIPPRPLDFVLDHPDAISILRKKCGLKKPAEPKIESSEVSVHKSKVQVKKSVNSTEKKRKLVEGPLDKKQIAPAKKSKRGSAVSLTPRGLKTLLPVKPKPPVTKKPATKVCRSRTPAGLKTRLAKPNETNNEFSNSVILESAVDANTPSKLVLGKGGSGRYLLAEKSIVSHVKSNGSDAATSMLSPKDLNDPRLARFLLQPGGKMQIPKSLKLIRLVPSSKPSGIKPITQYLPRHLPAKPSVAENSSPQVSALSKNSTPGSINRKEDTTTYSPALSKKSSTDPINRKEDSNKDTTISSELPFELPTLHPVESAMLGESNAISDIDYDMATPTPTPGLDSTKPKRTPRTYGKKGYSRKTSRIVENAVGFDADDSFLRTESGLFTDVDVDKRNGECVQDPLNAETNGTMEIKAEPIDSWEDLDDGDSFVMFQESYDIFEVAGKEEPALSTAFDTSVPFDVICESSQVMTGGMYNARCPWEQVKARKPSNRTISNENPFKSKKLLENVVCDPHSPTIITSSANKECNLKVSNGNAENNGGLVNYRKNSNGGNFVHEPMIYAFDKLIYDNPPVCDISTNRSESVVISSEQSCTSHCSYSKNSKSDCKSSTADNHKDEFLDLVNYLINYNSHKFLNQPMIYAVDKIIYDHPPTMSNSRKNGRESKNKRRGRSSTVVPHEQGCSQDTLDSKTGNDSSKSGMSPKKPDSTEEFTPPKKRRKRNSSILSKGVGLENSGNVSSDNTNLPDDGGFLATDNSLTRAATTMSVGENVESNSKSPGVKKARKSVRNADRTQESPVPVTSQKKRSSRKVLNVHDVKEIAPGVIVPSSEDAEEKVPKKKGRPLKPKSKQVLNGMNVPRSSFALATSDQLPQESILYIQGDNDPQSDVLVPAERRIIYNSRLVDPLRMVECAICGENMTAALYKKDHLIKHNHLCWLKGEEPMDLDDEKGVERYLYRIYLKRRVPFTCGVCGAAKKSALGFVTHRRFCGKTVQERKELMVSCSVCSRILLPSSLHNHMVKTHPAVASAPEEPPLEGRQAASKCLDVLAMSAKDIKDDQEYIDDSEERKAAEKNSWIRQAYSFCKRRVHKEQKNLMMESTTQEGQKYHCIIADCSFSDNNITNVIEHYRACDMEPLDCKCKDCPFMTNVETRMINHVRMIHFGKAKEYAPKEFKSNEAIDVSDVSGSFIPYVKSGEMWCRSMLYLQPALYWTHDLREEHLSTEPLFTDWDVSENLDVKAFDDFPSHLCLRDDSIRFKSTENTPEWSILKKFASQSLDDDVRILYTGGIVRTLDWFPSSETQYLALGVASVDSDSISARPVHSGPGHFQIWSAGPVDNFSEPYDVDLRFYVAVCHDFGEIWDLECCPSGGITDKRLGLLAIGTSSGVVSVYSVPILEESPVKRAIKPDPVVMLKLGTKESFQVSKISWSKTKPHRFIAAGFTNGLVAVWDLTTTSTLLKSGNTLLPFKSFYPHLAIITALSFSPVNEFYIATGCAEKCSKFWNLRDTTVNHGEFTRGLVTDVAWLPHWMAALTSLDDNYTTGTTTVTLNPIRNFIYQSQPAVTQADSTGTSISVNNWLNTFVCGYDSGQIILSIERKYIQHLNDDRRKVFNCLLSPRLHDFEPNSLSMGSCKSYPSTSARYGLILNHNFQMKVQMKIKGNPCTDLACFPLTPVNKVCWNPNPNSFLTLATGLHSGFIIISRVKLPSMEVKLIKSIVESFNS